MADHKIQVGKAPAKSATERNGKGDMIKTAVGGSVSADKTGANRRGRR